MKKSNIFPMPEYYDSYIGLVDDVELMEAFNKSVKELDDMDLTAMSEIGLRTYAPDKWTIKEIVQHLADVERIFSYRTLLIARNDRTLAAGFDQDYLAANSNANARSHKMILKELKTVRLSTISFFEGLDTEQLMRIGMCWKYQISVLAMGFAIIGHQIHHLNIIKEKYLPLIQKVQINS